VWVGLGQLRGGEGQVRGRPAGGGGGGGRGGVECGLEKFVHYLRMPKNEAEFTRILAWSE
jgi:hypothetical protein